MFNNNGLARIETILCAMFMGGLIPIVCMGVIVAIICFLSWTVPTYNTEAMSVFWVIDRICAFIGFGAGFCWSCSDEWLHEHQKAVDKRAKIAKEKEAAKQTS